MGTGLLRLRGGVAAWGLGVSIAVGFAGPADAAHYTLSVLVKSGDVVDGRTIGTISGNIDISDNGKVAFLAGHTGGPGPGTSIFTQDQLVISHGTVLSGETVLLDPTISFPQINNAGTVVFGSRNAGVDRIFSQSALIVEPGNTIDGNNVVNVSPIPTINNAGTIVFRTTLTTLGAALATPTAVLKKVGDDIAPGDPLDNRVFANMSSQPQINHAGEVSHISTYVSGVTQVPSVFSLTEPLVLRGETVSGASPSAATFLSFSGRPTRINDDGDVAFYATKNSPANAPIIAMNDTQLARVGDVIDGHTIASINTGFALDIDDLGNVVFIQTDTAGRRTVFTQSEAVTDGSVPVDGISDFTPGTLAINSSGLLAIRVTYGPSGSSSAILLATPVPEPGSCALLGLAGLLMLLRRR